MNACNTDAVRCVSRDLFLAPFFCSAGNKVCIRGPQKGVSFWDPKKGPCLNPLTSFGSRIRLRFQTQRAYASSPCRTAFANVLRIEVVVLPGRGVACKDSGGYLVCRTKSMWLHASSKDLMVRTLCHDRGTNVTAILKEWSLEHIYMAEKCAPETCLCSHYPILEVCVCVCWITQRPMSK